MKTLRTEGPGTARLKLMLDGISKKVGKVGFFNTSKYEDGTPVAYVAAIQEFGSPEQGIPSRSFMRSTVANRQNAWRATARKGANAMLKGSATGDQVLELIGLQAAGDIRKTISQIQEPPLAPATIAARLRGKADKSTIGNLTKPLVDSGTMLNAVSNSVEDK